MGVSIRLPNLLFCSIVGICLFLTPAHGQIRETRRVVALSELGVSSPAVASVVRNLDAALEADSTYRVEFYNEYLETALFPDEASQANIRAWFIQKYQLRKPDVIIAVGPTPTEFMVAAHARFFPGVPIVFCCSSEQQAGYPQLDAQFTGTWIDFDTDKTLDAVIRLLPRTKNVVVVGGVSEFDRRLEDLVEKTERKHDALKFTYLTNLPMETVFERVRHLPHDTIILFTSLSSDAGGRKYNPNPEIVRTLAESANAPIFTLSDTLVGQGAVGGYVVRYLDQGKSVAAITLKVLHGTKPREVGISKQTGTYMFDWRALRRWGIDENSLPTGSIVLNHQPSFWELYWRYVIASVFLILAQALIILALLWQRARAKKAEAELSDSRSRLEGIVESAMDAVISIDEDQRIVVFNHAAEKVFGCPARDAIGSPVDRFIPERFREAHREHVRYFGDTGNTTRARGVLGTLWGLRANGKEFPIEASISQTRVGGKKLFTVIARDITERKQAEEALSSVSRRLIEAHEEERTRVARELHDDINQRIALLSVSLDGLKQDLPVSDDKANRRIDEVRERVSDLGDDVQALSHRLHSSKLDYLGLESAAAGFCREFSALKNVEVDFHAERVPKDLPKEISICLFRVLQEALQNALKHSGSRHFAVSLRDGTNAIELTVHDSGAGFDPEEAISRHGLGLTSMKERLKLVDGQFVVDSNVQRGTTVHARVPLSPKVKSAGIGG
jgi:PAS domain S-box-containing protein